MKLTEPMKKTLRNLYRHYKFEEPFIPHEGRGVRPTRSTRALVNRGFAKEIRDNHYVITQKGIDYIHQSNGISIPMVSDWKGDIDSAIERAKHVFNNFSSRRDLGLWAGYFQSRAQALYQKAISNWDKGGWIEDRKTYQLARVYKYLALLAWEHLDNQTAS